MGLKLPWFAQSPCSGRASNSLSEICAKIYSLDVFLEERFHHRLQLMSSSVVVPLSGCHIFRQEDTSGKGERWLGDDRCHNSLGRKQLRLGKVDRGLGDGLAKDALRPKA